MFGKKDILTLPNLFTLFRLCSIPLFLWLLFIKEERLAAAWLLGVLGSTDWVDGWIARKFNQVSEFGAIFDPTVDRLLFFVAVPSIIIDGSVPLWVAGLALFREIGVAMAALLSLIKFKQVTKVTFAGKTGAFFLMFAFPMFLGANTEASYNSFLLWCAWICTIPGLIFGLYSLFVEYIPNSFKKFNNY